MPNNKQLFNQLLKLKRSNMKPHIRKLTKKSTEKINWLYPTATERKYAKGITALMRSTTLPATEEVFSQLDGWIDDYNLTTGRIDSLSKQSNLSKRMILDSVFDNQPIGILQFIRAGYLSKKKRDSFRADIEQLRKDSYTNDFKLFILGLQKTFDKKVQDPNTRAFITTIGFDVADKNRNQWGKFSKKLLGIEFISDESWEIETIEAWGDTNLGLIKGMGDEYVKKINTVVSEGVQFGRTSQSIRKEIRKLNKDINVTRANLIARDQVGKLNGQLTKRRQQDAGLDLYIWSTVQDERVRGNPSGKNPKAVPSHFLMNGKVCKWNDNTVYSDDGGKTWKKRTGKMPIAIPGEEIQCRCSGLAFFADVLEEIDKGIEESEKERLGEIEEKKPVTKKKATKKKKPTEESILEILGIEEPAKKKSVSIPKKPEKESIPTPRTIFLNGEDTAIVTSDSHKVEKFMFNKEQYRDAQVIDLIDYKRAGYKNINRFLVDSPKLSASASEIESIQSKIKNIDSAFSNTVLKQNATVYRAVDSKSMVTNAEQFVGKEITGTKYWSTSLQKKSANYFLPDDNLNSSAIFKIKAKKGTPAINMENMTTRNNKDDEREILLGRDQKYKVTNVIKEKGKPTIFEMETI